MPIIRITNQDKEQQNLINNIKLLAESKDEENRLKAARDENCPADILAELSTDKSKKVKERVARNVNTSAYTLSILANDPSEMVRETVAQNPNLSDNTAEILANDESEYVRFFVATRTKNIQIIETLTNDKNKDVYTGAIRNENCPEKILREIVKDNNNDKKIAVALNKCCPEELLATLAKQAENIRRADRENLHGAIVKNKNCPSDIKKAILICDEIDLTTRIIMAETPDTPKEVLEMYANKLQDEYDDELAWGLASNESSDKKILKSVIESTENSEMEPKDKAYILERTAKNPNCPQSYMKKFAEHEHWVIRAGVAINENCPISILTKLTRDSSPRVRRSAMNNPTYINFMEHSNGPHM